MFAGIGLALGILAAVFAWAAMRERRGPLLLLGLVIGSIGCQVVAWKIGAKEWQQFWDAVERAPVGAHMWRPPSVLFVAARPRRGLGGAEGRELHNGPRRAPARGPRGHGPRRDLHLHRLRGLVTSAQPSNGRSRIAVCPLTWKAGQLRLDRAQTHRPFRRSTRLLGPRPARADAARRLRRQRGPALGPAADRRHRPSRDARGRGDRRALRRCASGAPARARGRDQDRRPRTSTPSCAAPTRPRSTGCAPRTRPSASPRSPPRSRPVDSSPSGTCRWAASACTRPAASPCSPPR